MNNSTLTAGYRLNTVGVYFRSPDDGLEYLFGAAIHQATPEEPSADFIFPFNGITTTGLLFDLIANVGNADNINLNVDPASVVTVKMLEAHNHDPNAHPDLLGTAGVEISDADIPATGVRTHHRVMANVPGWMPDSALLAGTLDVEGVGLTGGVLKKNSDVKLHFTALTEVGG